MAYIHSNRTPVVFNNDPIRLGEVDWFYFSYQDWLRDNETITTHTASIVGGVIETSSSYFGDVTDSLGVVYSNCYGVEISASTSCRVVLTHSVTSTVTGIPDAGRTIIRSIVIPVGNL